MTKFNLERLREIARPLSEEERERINKKREENKRKFEEWKNRKF